ncbi:FixH family protein [Rossellomorea aquimaris]|uniref:FixH family protein n=1 Tax=Rossellomorea aquimaris TaxID=189382 RepID=UPI0009EE1A4F|nr:FixH family protein [Rossellomorea aquimaris]
MKKISFTLMIILLMITVAACSSNEMEGPKKVEVNIQLPEEISINEETSLKVKVFQGDTDVTDADEVNFEIWKNDSEKKVK